MTVPALSLNRISKTFADRTVVSDLSLEIAAGSVVCLLGGSGSGKSTTLKIAAGIERPDGGEVRVDGAVVDGATVFVPPEKRRVGLVFQDLALFPHLTAEANVGFGLLGQPPAEARRCANDLLKTVGLSHLAHAFPHQLSGGEQQRLAVARALAPNPRVMLLDEPFSGLDDRLRDEVRGDVLSILRGQGAGVLLVTHDPDEALASADHIVLLREGRVVQSGTAHDMLLRPADLGVAAFFSPINQLEATIQAGQACTSLGAVPVSMPDETRVIVALRPHDLELAESGVSMRIIRATPAANGIHASAVSRDGGLEISAVFDAVSGMAAGDVVSMRIKPGRGHVFPAGVNASSVGR